jgi:hypothetical protein
MTLTFIKWVIGASLLLALLVTAASLYGAQRWRSLTDELNGRLEASRKEPSATRYDARELDGLPAPVQRYFRAVLTDGAPIVATAAVTHAGTFNMGETKDQWKSFTSEQRVVTQAPGFVWNGRIAMLPGVPVLVHDAYFAGEGLLRPAIFGLITLVNLQGKGEIARGELMRFFAEAAWYPTALLPSQGVRWEAINDTSARATLTDGPISLTMTFTFGADDLIKSVLAESRGRTVAGKVIPTPWEGRWSNYQRQGGMLVAMTGEVAWLLPEGAKPYWRGTITALDYEFQGQAGLSSSSSSTSRNR